MHKCTRENFFSVQISTGLMSTYANVHLDELAFGHLYTNNAAGPANKLWQKFLTGKPDRFLSGTG